MIHRLIATATVACTVLAAAPAAVAAQEHDCVINPAVTVRLGSPVAGLIDTVHVEPGSVVSVGDRIATLRSEVERTTVEVIEEQARSKAEIEAQRARLDLSRSRLNRTERLVKRNIAAAEELETARAEMEVISRELALTEMRQRVAMLELRRAREQLEQRTIRSPVDGVVVDRALFSGEFLHQEAHVVTIAQIDPLIVEAFLPVELFYDIRPGMTATVYPNAPVNGSHEGRVKVADRVFDAASSTFGVKIHLDNPDHALPAGHRCRVTFEGIG